MWLSTGVLLGWLLLTFLPIAAVMGIGLWKIRSLGPRTSPGTAVAPVVPVEILVPVKGSNGMLDYSLKSLLEQTYSEYGVLFIVESPEDSANEVVDRLCAKHPHARKAVSGSAVSCGQKNHNLVEGVKHLKSDTKIIVFCDSTNVAHPEWLAEFTLPLRSGASEVVTTFRAFEPDPETIGGVGQAIYASFVRLLITVKPKPWGGATGMLRETFESQLVMEAWSRTVVDDLILGNVLDAAGIPVRMDPVHLLRSPVRNQTIKGLYNYLERQILFPKFTNPGIWVGSMVLTLSMTAASLVTVWCAVLLFLGRMEPALGILSLGFQAAVVLTVAGLRFQSPSRVSLRNWFLALPPLAGMIALILVRSIFLNYIDWHGKRYWCGAGGEVLFVEPGH